MRLEGKVAIVSGGASGIGEATSRLFAREGASVVIADVNDELGGVLESDIKNGGQEAAYMHLDVTDEAQWQRVVAATINMYARLDIVVNSAGISVPGRPMTEDQSVDGWDAVMAVNARGVFLGTKHAIPEMRNVGGGSVINISSVYGNVGSRGGTAYHASKGAVRTFSKAAAIQYADEQIRVNSVHPGFIDTPMTAGMHSQPDVHHERVRKTPLGRMGVPSDIAYGILYLASEESSFVTGSELIIDGGMTAQ
ncbi:MAG: glucose 1-dehydrogenase [Dehalococcoidia bacterium]|jgi:NAD(P)-dependent dehydrogenase (short-subunit alcohol dehydrogenase family)